VVALAAGLLFGVSHQVSQGTNLRSSETSNLADVVRAAEARVTSENAQLTALQAQVRAATDQAGGDDAGVAAAQAKGQPLRTPAGLTAATGPGLVVVLDDARQQPNDPDVDPNQLVVHQSDMQAVVNALWAGGAEAMSISGQRVIATSAVRCVGNTLLLNGRVFSPPFRVVAIGPAGTMQGALDHSGGVSLFKQAASYYGLGYTVESDDALAVPAYDGSLGLSYAKVAAR
jgi:uncharacterized protein YlxW (UPF0749 family)